MSYLNKSLQKQSWLGINKANSEPVQVLLKTTVLLKTSCFFIEPNHAISAETCSESVFQLLVKLTVLTTWISHVTMLFLSFFNKRKAHFLIPVMLAIAYSSSYLIAE